MLPFDLKSARSTSLRIFRESPRFSPMHISNLNLKYSVASPNIIQAPSQKKLSQTSLPQQQLLQLQLQLHTQQKQQQQQQQPQQQKNKFFQQISLGSESPQISAEQNCFKNRIASPNINTRVNVPKDMKPNQIMERISRSRSEMIPSNPFSASEQFFSSIAGMESLGYIKKTKKLHRHNNNGSIKDNNNFNSINTNNNHKEIVIWKQEESGMTNTYDDNRPITRQFPKTLTNRLNSRGHFPKQLFLPKQSDASLQKILLKLPEKFAENGISVNSYLLEHAKRENQATNKLNNIYKEFLYPTATSTTESLNRTKSAVAGLVVSAMAVAETSNEGSKTSRKSKYNRLKEIATFGDYLSGGKKSTFVESTFKNDLIHTARSSKSTKLSSQSIFQSREQQQQQQYQYLTSKIQGGGAATPTSSLQSTVASMRDQMSQQQQQQIASTQTSYFGVDNQLAKNAGLQFDMDQPLSRYTQDSIATEHYDICEYVKDHEI